MSDVTGQFTISGMGGEEAVSEHDSLKLTRANGEQQFSGGIEGRGHIEWLLLYRPDKTAEFVGLQEIDGSVDGRSGTFAMTAVGAHDGKQSKGRWTVVPGSGTRQLAGISGTGDFTAGPGPHATFHLTYELG